MTATVSPAVVHDRRRQEPGIAVIVRPAVERQSVERGGTFLQPQDLLADAHAALGEWPALRTLLTEVPAL